MLQHCRHGIRLLASGPSSSSSYHTIQAVPREWTGCKVAQGRIPSVVFRQGEIEDITNGRRPISKKQLLTTDRKQINSILKTVQQPFLCSTTFNLQIHAGPSSSLLLDSGTVLPIKLHTNPENGEILNLVFVWADGDSELNVDVPLVFKGEDVCPGLKKGVWPESQSFNDTRLEPAPPRWKGTCDTSTKALVKCNRSSSMVVLFVVCIRYLFSSNSELLRRIVLRFGIWRVRALCRISSRRRPLERISFRNFSDRGTQLVKLIAKLQQYCYLLSDLTPELLGSKCSSYEELQDYLHLWGA